MIDPNSIRYQVGRLLGYAVGQDVPWAQYIQDLNSLGRLNGDRPKLELIAFLLERVERLESKMV